MKTVELSKYTATQAIVALRERRNCAEAQVERLLRYEGDDPRDLKASLRYWRGVIESANEAIEEICSAWEAP